MLCNCIYVVYIQISVLNWPKSDHHYVYFAKYFLDTWINIIFPQIHCETKSVRRIMYAAVGTYIGVFSILKKEFCFNWKWMQHMPNANTHSLHMRKLLGCWKCQVYFLELYISLFKNIDTACNYNGALFYSIKCIFLSGFSINTKNYISTFQYRMNKLNVYGYTYMYINVYVCGGPV